MTEKDHKPAKPTFTMKAVQSSSIAEHGYDAGSRTLAVKFANGGIYHFTDVPPDVAKALADAKSVGSYFAAHVRGKFTSAKQ